MSKVQKKIGNEYASLGSLSECARLFEPNRLKGIISQLSQQVCHANLDPKTAEFVKSLVAVDGSVVNALPSILAASVLKQTTGSGIVRWRLHTHFEVASFTPSKMEVTPDGGGEHDERAVMQRSIEPDKIYAMDRGYAKFRLFNAINSQDSSYVCRLRDNSVIDVEQEHPLSDGDRAAGVISDQRVSLGKSSKKEDRPDHSIRLICIKCTPHKNRTGGRVEGSKAPDSDGVLRIATNLLGVPAEIIAILYQYRGSVEIFFRFYKQFMGGSHLISHNANGIQIQAYCAMIACLIMNIWVGGRPSKRTFEMISFYFMGIATEAELIAHLEKVRKKAEMAAAKNE